MSSTVDSDSPMRRSILARSTLRASRPSSQTSRVRTDELPRQSRSHSGPRGAGCGSASASAALRRRRPCPDPVATEKPAALQRRAAASAILSAAPIVAQRAVVFVDKDHGRGHRRAPPAAKRAPRQNAAEITAQDKVRVSSQVLRLLAEPSVVAALILDHLAVVGQAARAPQARPCPSASAYPTTLSLHRRRRRRPRFRSAPSSRPSRRRGRR